jgi:hypothetical protein
VQHVGARGVPGSMIDIRKTVHFAAPVKANTASAQCQRLCTNSMFICAAVAAPKQHSCNLYTHDQRLTSVGAGHFGLQGTQGLVRAEGNGHWRWVDVLDTWSPATSTGVGGLSGPALALAVALPVVFGVLVLACCGGLAWWRRRRRYVTVR